MAEQGNLTLRGMLVRAARWHGEQEAIVDASLRYTYAELLDHARRCATALAQLGVRKGDRVIFLTLSSSLHGVAWYACQIIGALPVCLHIRENPPLLARTIARFRPAAAVYDVTLEPLIATLATLTDTLPKGRIRLNAAGAVQPMGEHLASVLADYELPRDFSVLSPHAMNVQIEEADRAAIVLSSGTTSTPKGVIHTQRTLMEGARGGNYLFHCTERSSVINILSTSFIGWLNMSLPFLNVGAKVVCAHRWNPHEYVELLAREKVSFAFLIPTMWRLLFRDVRIESYDLSAVTLAGFAGEVMDVGTLQKIRQYFCRDVVNMYGSTETALSGGAIMRSDDMEGDFIRSVGKPFMNSDIRIVAPNGALTSEMPPGEPGEVLITGPSVAVGMWEDPELEGRVILHDGQNRWWRSGDRGYLREPGFLFIDGRTDDMIISGGININPVDIEAVLAQHEKVAECAVVGLPDEEFGQVIVAFVVPKPDKPTQAELDAYIVQDPMLSRYQRPRHYRFVDALPKTATGKTSRSALRQMGM